MSRMGVTILLVLLAAGGAAVAVLNRPRSAEESARGQIRPTLYDPAARQPKDAGLYTLQWLADGVRCPVSDNLSLMASCVLQRYGKMRDKALSARARYDALVGLERAYWANLAREGLTQRIEHVPTH